MSTVARMDGIDYLSLKSGQWCCTFPKCQGRDAATSSFWCSVLVRKEMLDEDKGTWSIAGPLSISWWHYLSRSTTWSRDAPCCHSCCYLALRAVMQRKRGGGHLDSYVVRFWASFWERSICISGTEKLSLVGLD